MKKLFFALLVLNLVLWLWGKRQELAPPVPVEPGVGIIRLLGDAEVKARRDQAAEAAAAEATNSLAAASPRPADAMPELADQGADAVTEVAVTEPPKAGSEIPTEPEQVVASVVEELPLPPTALATEAQIAGEIPGTAGTSAEVAVATLPDQNADETSIAAPVVAAPATEAPAMASSAADEMPTPIAREPESRQQAPAPTDAAARDDAPTAAPSSSPTPAALVEAAPVEHPAPPPLTIPAMSPATICESAGPFRDRAAAERYVAALRPPLANARVREEASARPARYWVVAPAAKDADPVYRQGLGEAGVRDAWRVKTGPLAGRLSLGAFQQEDNARKHVADLAAKGVSAELQAVKEQERRWWVDYERPVDTAQPNRSVAGGERTRQIVERRCNHVAAP